MKVFSSYKMEEEAQRVADYINDQFVMFTDMPLKIFDNRENEIDNYSSNWCLMMRENCAEYKVTVDKARTAVGDFRRGYAMGVKAK